MRKFNVDNLVVEITRRCNASCSFCLRGDSVNEDMNLGTMQELLKNISEIGMLTFSGGEPSLAVNGINAFMSIVRLFNIYIGRVYVATNGVDIKDDFINCCLDMLAYADYPDESAIDWYKAKNIKDYDEFKKYYLLSGDNDVKKMQKR